MKKKKEYTVSLQFLGPLTLIFVTLKLLDKIDWAWWWVLAPLWVPFAVVAIALGVALTAVLLVQAGFRCARAVRRLAGR
ncbi:MAG: hypothetical protein HY954_07555 [Deltaproteobacteria bacterium]|nr:hypothetical protein [Deltaproteobacteria bacterium]